MRGSPSCGRWPAFRCSSTTQRGCTLPESSTIVEYLDGHGDRPALVPVEPAAALQTRLWDRVIDGHVMTPMQKIVGDSLRPECRADPEGVAEAHALLARAYMLLRCATWRRWLARGSSLQPGRLRRGTRAALCARRAPLGRGRPHEPDAVPRRADRTSVRRRIVDEARDYRASLPAALARLRRLAVRWRRGVLLARAAAGLQTMPLQTRSHRGGRTDFDGRTNWVWRHEQERSAHCHCKKGQPRERPTLHVTTM